MWRISSRPLRELCRAGLTGELVHDLLQASQPLHCRELISLVSEAGYEHLVRFLSIPDSSAS